MRSRDLKSDAILFRSSGEDDSGAVSQFYHHEPPTNHVPLIDPLEQILLCQNDDDNETEEDKNWPSPEIELSPEVKDVLQASWKHLQERQVLNTTFTALF